MSLLYKYKYDIISVYVFLEKAKKPLQTQDDKPRFSATMLCIISTVPHIPGNGLLLHWFGSCQNSNGYAGGPSQRLQPA